MKRPILLASTVVISLQATRSQLVPVYRALAEPRPAMARFDEQCGASTGPFTVFRPDADPASKTALVKSLDDGRVIDISRAALSRAADALPGPPVTICLYPGELVDGLPHLGGVGGVSLGAGRIKLFLHPAPGRLERVSYTVAHEYHHEVERVAGPGGSSPIDIVVREGKADHFAVSLYPHLRPAHTQALSDAELKMAWGQLAEHERTSSPTFRRDFMIGAFTPGSTKWPGYRLGYQMVEQYFKGSKATHSDIVSTPARAIHQRFRQQLRTSGRPDAAR